MKKIILITLCFTLEIVFAQCYETINTNTTDWRKFPNGTSQNSWNWTSGTASDWVSYIKTRKNSTTGKVLPTSVGSPFFAPNPVIGTSCTNTNVCHFQFELDKANVDFHPEDGWELLYRNFGACGNTDLSLCEEFAATDNPSFALYNKYTSTIRYFVCLTDKDPTISKKGAIITLSIPNASKKRDIIATGKPIRTHTTDFDNTLSIESPTYYASNQLYWLYADFPVSYDPCTCRNPTEFQQITFETKLITQFDVVLNAQTTSTTEEQVKLDSNGDGIGDNVNVSGNRNLSFGKVASNVFGGVIDISKNISGLGQLASTTFEDANPIFKNILAGKLFEDGPITFDNISFTQNKASDFIKNSKGNKYMWGMSDDEGFVVDVMNAASNIPFIGSAMGLIDSFTSSGGFLGIIGNIIGADETTTPIEPKLKQNEETYNTRSTITTRTNMSITGTLKADGVANRDNINIPGSSTNTLSPFYNNILGDIGILYVPSLKHADYSPLQVGNDTYGYGYCGTGDKFNCKFFYNYFSPTPFNDKIRQFALDGDLKYKVNPNSGLEIFSIEGAFILEYKSDVPYTNKNQIPWGINSFVTGTSVNYMNLSFGNLYPLTASSTIENLSNKGHFRNSEIYLEYMSKGYPTNGFARLRTKYYPLSYLQKASFTLLQSRASDATNIAPKVYLKLYIKLKRKNSPSSDFITKVISVEIPGGVESSRSIGSSSLYTANYVESYPQNIPLPTAANHVGFKSPIGVSTALIPFLEEDPTKSYYGESYNFDAKGLEDDLTINNAIVNNQFKEAKNSITVTNSEITGESVLQTSQYNNKNIGLTSGIQSLAYYSSNSTEIENMCKVGSYKTKAGVGSRLEAYASTEPTPPAAVQYFKPSLKAVPNPTTGRVTFYYKIASAGEVSIKIANVMGTEVVSVLERVPKEIGNYEQDLNLSALPTGVYVVTIECNGYKNTERLVVSSN
ncbi:MAG: T9SS C-terminal target domain-containing protein [Bacteroidetes bacterium]|nr:MAG: T9SS C-terminal target domain-containing protein [Bacteroidota bacterium]